MRWPHALVFLPLLLAAPAWADLLRGQYQYSSAQACAADRKVGADQCANAAANAEAEFDEKAPHFSSREACDRSVGRSGCSLGIGGAGGYVGKRSEIYFIPRQSGFRIKVTSQNDATVVPLGAGIAFSPRTILRRDTHLNPKIAQQAHRVRPMEAFDRGGRAGGPAGPTEFGVASPEGVGGPLPAAPRYDPNFDCAAVLDPGLRGDPNTGCYPAPVHRR